MAHTTRQQSPRMQRHARIRARVKGTASRPRLAVFRSNRYIYAQLIDDTAEKTIAAADSRRSDGKDAKVRATEVGQTIAREAKKKGVGRVVFDRGGFRYQGLVAALADAARAGGLKF